MTKTKQQQQQKSNDFKEGVFFQFVQDLCRVKEVINLEKFEQICLIIGYLISSNAYGANKTIIFSDNGKGNRSGKSLLLKFIAKYLNGEVEQMTELCGENYNYRDRFAYMKCTEETNLIHLDNVPKDFYFIPIIRPYDTNLVRVHQQSKAPFKIKVEWVITTNYKLPDYLLKIDTVEVFYMTDYYNKSYQPAKKYGQLFFNNWGIQEYKMTGLFMDYCKDLYHASTLPF